jgi:CRP-like cAMP-binding protein
LLIISEQGKEAVVGIFGPGQFFGEGCMNGHSVRIATTTAMEDSTRPKHHDAQSQLAGQMKCVSACETGAR